MIGRTFPFLDRLQISPEYFGREVTSRFDITDLPVDITVDRQMKVVVDPGERVSIQVVCSLHSF